jgi:hypothetical protein
MEQVTITLPERVAVLVGDDEKPQLWGEEGERTLSVFGDYWRAYRDAGSKTLKIKELSREELEDLLRGPWQEVTHVVYFPAADGFAVSKERIIGA